MYTDARGCLHISLCVLNPSCPIQRQHQPRYNLVMSILSFKKARSFTSTDNMYFNLSDYWWLYVYKSIHHFLSSLLGEGIMEIDPPPQKKVKNNLKKNF